MFCIITYHLLIFGLNPQNPDVVLYKALQIPLHIGVPLFVMISGYFGIKFSFRGLLRLLSKFYIFIVPLTLIPALYNGAGIKDIFERILPLGFNNLWYINCYLYLFLLSPVINHFFKDITLKQRIYLFTILSFMSIYIGNITQGDPSLVDGKNLTNFILLYLVGNTIRHYQIQINKISGIKLTIVYIILNILLVLGFMYVPIVAGKIWKYSFGYCSPLIYVNCILVFMLFSKIRVNSKYINILGGSIYVCYLLQCPAIIWDNLYLSPVLAVDKWLNNSCLTLLFISLFAIIAIHACTLIDNLFSFIWKSIDKYAITLDEKYKIIDITK